MSQNCVGVRYIKKKEQKECKEALAIRRIFSLVAMITKVKFSNSPNDFKIRLFGQYHMYS